MKLLLADDHTLFRDTLVQFIKRAEPDAELTAVGSFYEAYEHLEQGEEFDLILLDLYMPGMKGLQGLHQIKNNHPDARVSIMSGLAEEDDVRRAFDIGAAGYFPKTMSGKAMLSAIQLVLTGDRFIPIDQTSNIIMPSYRSEVPPHKNGFAPSSSTSEHSDYSQLTPRERDVLEFLAKGASNKEIARELDLQVVTIKLHVRGICKKLNAKNRTQAALKAREIGLVD